MAKQEDKNVAKELTAEEQAAALTEREEALAKREAAIDEKLAKAEALVKDAEEQAEALAAVVKAGGNVAVAPTMSLAEAPEVALKAPKDGVLHMSAIAGGYELGTGEWRGPLLRGSDFRAHGGKVIAKKVDERYTHTFGTLSRVLCIGGDPALAKVATGAYRVDDKSKIGVGSRIALLALPEFHAILGYQIIVDRIAAAFDGFGFKIIAWAEDNKTGKQNDLTSLLFGTEQPYDTTKGVYYNAERTTQVMAVQPGTTVYVAIEVTSMPTDIDAFMAALRSTESADQFRAMVALNYVQGRPQVDEGLGDQYVRGNYDVAQ